MAAGRTADGRSSDGHFLRRGAAMSAEQELAGDCQRRQGHGVHDEGLPTREGLHVQNSSEQRVRHQRPVAVCHGLLQTSRCDNRVSTFTYRVAQQIIIISVC